MPELIALRAPNPIVIGRISLDPEQRVVSKDGVPVRLTPKEFRLLHHLKTHAGVPVTYESLLKALWVDDHIGRVGHLRIFRRQLRTKLNEFDLLLLLMKNQEVRLPYEAAGRGPKNGIVAGDTGYLRSYIKTLRGKIKKRPGES